MNMKVLKRSRKQPQPGDIFVYRMPDSDYGFGRVIRTDANMDDTWCDLLLVYIYNAFSAEKEQIPLLDKRRLLIPPALLFDKGPWTRGRFETVARCPLKPQDVLKVHCFIDEVNSCFVDEYSRRLRRKSDPCDIHAVGNHLTIDAQISSALGIEPHPDTVPKLEPRMRKNWDRGIKPKDLPMPELLRQLLEDLEDLGDKYRELYDTSVCEVMDTIIDEAFVRGSGDFAMPEILNMETRPANRDVADCLAKYIVSARVRADKDGLNTRKKRLDAFQDEDVVTDKGQRFDDFFSHREKP